MNWQEWMNRAACRPGSGIDPEGFFPVGQEDPDPEALAACQRCEVSEKCLVYSLREPGQQIDFGVWAGMDRDERQREKRRRNRHLAAVAS